MTLQQYADEYGFSDAELAEKFGLPAHTVAVLREGRRAPGLRLALAIDAATEKKVTPWDWGIKT